MGCMSGLIRRRPGGDGSTHSRMTTLSECCVSPELREAPPSPTTSRCRRRRQADHGESWRAAVDEAALLDGFDRASFLAGRTTPMLSGAAVMNIGIRQLLDTLVEVAPQPIARPDVHDVARQLDAPFSGIVFKVQAGMDAAHRDRVAFVQSALVDSSVAWS